jgi:hypothetical protein
MRLTTQRAVGDFTDNGNDSSIFHAHFIYLSYGLIRDFEGIRLKRHTSILHESLYMYNLVL